MTMQKTWIGRSEGAEIAFEVRGAPEGADAELKVFTTRPDTLMGATYVVVAPEHPLALARRDADGKDDSDLSKYIDAAARRSDIDRTAAKEKSGVYSGMTAVHPLTGEELPLWVADYVLAGYGTGAVMAVPAHDERDFAFAKAFDLPIKQVVSPGKDASTDELEEAFTGPGVCVNSGEGLDGLPTEDAKSAVIDRLVDKASGERKITFKLRDWVFSRQRYWGEPIPIYFPVSLESEGGDPRKGDAHTIHYETPIAVDESELPVKLPELEDFKPGDDPSGCLARVLDWRFFQRDGKVRATPHPSPLSHRARRTACASRRLHVARLTRPPPPHAPCPPVVRSRDQHDAAVGGLVLVLFALRRPDQRGRGVGDGGGALVAARRPVRRWCGARGASPALRALLAQGTV